MAARSSPSPAEVLFKSFAAVAGAALGIWLLWELRSLIVPMAVGGLLAYICYPLVVRLERFRVTRGLAIGLLLLGFLSATILIASLLRSGVPREVRGLDFRTRLLHKVNER